MDIVIETVGNRVYTMAFNHYLLAPLSATELGVNVSVPTPSSVKARLYRLIHIVACRESSSIGTVDYSKLACAKYIRLALLLIKLDV